MKPESISGRQEATTYVLEYSQNLLRLKEYDPCVLKKRTLLKNALESAGVRMHSHNNQRPGARSRVGIDPFSLWIRDEVCDGSPKAAPLVLYMNNFYPFVGKEGLQILAPHLVHDLEDFEMLKLVPTEEELILLKSNTNYRSEADIKKIETFQKRVGMPLRYNRERANVGRGNYANLPNITETDIKKGIEIMKVILGNRAEEYRYGIKLILEQTGAQGRESEQILTHYARQVQYLRRSKKWQREETHEKLGGLKIERPISLHQKGTDEYLYMENEQNSDRIDEAWERYYEDLERTSEGNPRTETD